MKITKLSINQFLVLVVLTIFTFNTTSCVYEEATSLISEREDFTLDLPPFSVVTLDFPAKVFIRKGEQESIKINAQPEIFSALNKTVSDGEWLIDLINFNDGYERVTIEITIPSISGLHTTSTGDINIESRFDKVETLTLSVGSTGDIKYKGSATKMDLLIDGTGDIQLSGQADFLHAQLSSTGDLSAYDLTAEVVTLVSTSTGDAEIRVEKNLDVTMTGTGDVKYKGQPQITSNISGTGDLKDEN